MRPKNRVYCPSCHRQKMTFDTRKEADNFIKFNADEIEKEHGYKPIRAYYCRSCCSWHITSQSKYSINTDEVINIIKPFDDENTVFPQSDDFPRNTCIYKARYTVYESILAINHKEKNNIPETGENGLLEGLCAAKGYQKLANAETIVSFKSDADCCVKYMCEMLIRKIKANIEKLNQITQIDDINEEYISRSIMNQTYQFTAILHSFPVYTETALALKTEVDAQKFRIHRAYNSFKHAKTIKTKLDKYIAKIQESIKEKKFTDASKNIHFSVVLIQKNVNKENTQETIKTYIDKLIDYKHIIEKEQQKTVKKLENF